MRRVQTSTEKRLWPLPDPLRTCGVVIAIFPESGLGIVHPLQGDDAVFFCEDFLGDWGNVHQGHTVTFRVTDYGLGPIAEAVCNIHDPESEQALIDYQCRILID